MLCITAKMGWGRALWVLVVSKPSRSYAIKRPESPKVDGAFPQPVPVEQAKGWLGPQGGTLIAAISGWIPMMFMTRVRL